MVAARQMKSISTILIKEVSIDHLSIM